MNRIEEYLYLLDELEKPIPKLDTSFDRALKRKKRNTLIYRPLIGMITSFLLFVFLVNFSAPVAHACSQIPFLKELADAVTFSRSLSEAVKHDYIQEINLKQTDDSVTAHIEYLIVDQKQINIFYRLTSDRYHYLYVEPELLSVDTEEKLPCSTYWNNGNEPTENELQQITADFGDNNVPDTIKLQLSIVHYPNMEDETRTSDSNIFDIKNVIAKFHFTITLDPSFTDKGKMIPVDQTLLLDGQKITITDLEIYPTHLRINVSDDPKNTAWLKGLDYRIILDDNETFDPVKNGIAATGSSDSPGMVSFRTESSYFYTAKQLEIQITEALWLKKGMEKAYINLETGKTKDLPLGVALNEITEQEDTKWLSFHVPFIKEGHYHPVFAQTFYDIEGNEYTIEGFGTEGSIDHESSDEKYYIHKLQLSDFDGTEIWLSLNYSHHRKYATPITLKIPIE